MDESTDVHVFSGNQSTDSVEDFAENISNLLDLMCGTRFSYILALGDLSSPEGKTAVVSPVGKEAMKRLLEDITNQLDHGTVIDLNAGKH